MMIEGGSRWGYHPIWKKKLVEINNINRKQADNGAKCDANHPLLKYNESLGERGINGLNCDKCQRHFDCNEGYYNCGNLETCNFDVCELCIEKSELN